MELIYRPQEVPIFGSFGLEYLNNVPLIFGASLEFRNYLIY